MKVLCVHVQFSRPRFVSAIFNIVMLSFIIKKIEKCFEKAVTLLLRNVVDKNKINIDYCSAHKYVFYLLTDFVFPTLSNISSYRYYLQKCIIQSVLFTDKIFALSIMRGRIRKAKELKPSKVIHYLCH